jgi:hypothetical protein
MMTMNCAHHLRLALVSHRLHMTRHSHILHKAVLVIILLY